ncbi:hypothetical protein CABS03_10745 [Colletotrichum abscissum]|uniref:Uncharacterized protein n=1 Tax=Colletotrichum abscissum TaxID=1671311 RepID=A0A9P9XQ02_9PEZI|nr:hypothetical protein CABS02_01966 [Colletotrichum abscissum]
MEGTTLLNLSTRPSSLTKQHYREAKRTGKQSVHDGHRHHNRSQTLAQGLWPGVDQRPHRVRQKRAWMSSFQRRAMTMNHGELSCERQVLPSSRAGRKQVMTRSRRFGSGSLMQDIGNRKKKGCK